MKKIILTLLSLAFTTSFCFANDISDISSTFASYVNAANSYSTSLPKYYVKDAKIIRVVNKKQGGQKIVVIPYARYISELNKNSILAKTVKYKNNYINQKITKIDANNYKLSATRVPRNDKTGLSSYFIFTKTSSGWKIKEESMTTNVQTFLSAK